MTADEIMALALEFRNAERFKEISDSALALRAAVEQLVREREEVITLLKELDKRLDDERSAEDRQLRWRIYELVKGIK